MLPLDHPDRIQITFDDRRLVANAGLLLPVTLAQHLGLRELVDHHLDLGNAPGRSKLSSTSRTRTNNIKCNGAVPKKRGCCGLSLKVALKITVPGRPAHQRTTCPLAPPFACRAVLRTRPNIRC